jgi:protein TonB
MKEPPPRPPPPTFQTPNVVKKRRIAGEDPEYPRAARLAELEGLVVVKILITPEGTVGDIQFIKSDPHFDKEVRNAIKTWRFSRHIVNGKPVGTYTIFKFRFNLE